MALVVGCGLFSSELGTRNGLVLPANPPTNRHHYHAHHYYHHRPKPPFPTHQPPRPPPLPHQRRVFYTTDNVQSKPAVGSGTSSHLVYAGSWDGFLYAVRFCARTGAGSACTNLPTHVPTNATHPPPSRSMLTLVLSNGSGCCLRRRGIRTILARASMRRLPSPQLATSSSLDHTTGEPTLVLEWWVLVAVGQWYFKIIITVKE